jgi:hypothetical protein
MSCALVSILSHRSFKRTASTQLHRPSRPADAWPTARGAEFLFYAASDPRSVLSARPVRIKLRSPSNDSLPRLPRAQPDLLARHCTEAGLIDKAAGLWGKAGLRSLERSALVEAVEQLTRALGQISTLPSTPALRREQIKLQVALINPLQHVKGQAVPETKAAAPCSRH